MDPEPYRETLLPHSSFGDPDCCGCLYGVRRGDHAEILCNECGVIVRTLPLDDLEKTFTEMELTLDVSSAMCPHCGSVYLLPGFSDMFIFTCRSCGRVVQS
jgi:hypothetical protein